MAKILTKGNVGGDWLIREDEYEYTRDTMAIDNSSGSLGNPLIIAAGHPVTAALALCTGAGITTGGATAAAGLVLEKTAVPSGEKAKVAVVIRGQNVINVDALPTVDYAGAAIVKAT